MTIHGSGAKGFSWLPSREGGLVGREPDRRELERALGALGRLEALAGESAAAGGSGAAAPGGEAFFRFALPFAAGGDEGDYREAVAIAFRSRAFAWARDPVAPLLALEAEALIGAGARPLRFLLSCRDRLESALLPAFEEAPGLRTAFDEWFAARIGALSEAVEASFGREGEGSASAPAPRDRIENMREERTMVFDYGLFERARCGERDRRSLSPLVEELYGLSEKARREGLLALEEDLEGGKLDRFVELGLKLVVDGVAPERVDEILATSIYASGLRGKALLGRMMTFTGIRGIAAGLSPDLLRKTLEAYLGFETSPAAAEPDAAPAAAEALP